VPTFTLQLSVGPANDVNGCRTEGLLTFHQGRDALPARSFNRPARSKVVVAGPALTVHAPSPYWVTRDAESRRKGRSVQTPSAIYGMSSGRQAR